MYEGIDGKNKGLEWIFTAQDLDLDLDMNWMEMILMIIDMMKSTSHGSYDS